MAVTEGSTAVMQQQSEAVFMRAQSVGRSCAQESAGMLCYQ
jgi:hypothetical protein